MSINLKTLISTIRDLELEQLSADNPELKFETTPEGKLIVILPRGSLKKYY